MRNEKRKKRRLKRGILLYFTPKKILLTPKKGIFFFTYKSGSREKIFVSEKYELRKVNAAASKGRDTFSFLLVNVKARKKKKRKY